MVDISLMHSLLKAIAPRHPVDTGRGCGPAAVVGRGNVLRDIITSGVVETVRLTEIFRQRGRASLSRMRTASMKACSRS